MEQMKMATGNVGEDKASKLLKQIKADLEATHTRLLFAMEEAASEATGLVVKGQILVTLEGIARATRLTNEAFLEVEKLVEKK